MYKEYCWEANDTTPSKPVQARPEMSVFTELCCWETELGKHKGRSQKIKRDDDYYHILQSNQMALQPRRPLNPNNFSEMNLGFLRESTVCSKLPRT